MLAGHFAFATGRARGWLVLVALMVLSALVRHFYNRRHAGTNLWWIPAAVTVAVVALAVALRPQDSLPRGTATLRSTFARVQQIVDAALRARATASTRSSSTRRRWGSSSTRRTRSRAQAQAIKTQAVVAKQMPLGNVTHMTDAERGSSSATGSTAARRARLRRAGHHRRRLRVHRAPRGGGRAADRRRVPEDAAAREPDHPRPLERRGRLDAVGRPRARHRARERDALSEPGRARSSSPAASARRSSCSPTATSRSPRRPARSPATTSRRCCRATRTSARWARRCSGKARSRSTSARADAPPPWRPAICLRSPRR